MGKVAVVKKRDLPNDARITGFTFLKRSEGTSDGCDFVASVGGVAYCCMYSNRRSYGCTKGYVVVDDQPGTYLEVKSRSVIGVVVGVVLLIALLCGSWFVFGPFMGSDDVLTDSDNFSVVENTAPSEDVVVDDMPVFDLDQDASVEFGDRETRSQEEIQAELNEKVADGMITISMNPKPVFASGDSAGNFMIMNDTGNRHPQVIEIYRKDNDELVYKSGLIPVGGRVDSAKLLVSLPAGVYECIAYFNSVDENTGVLLGKAAAEVKITIRGS